MRSLNLYAFFILSLIALSGCGILGDKPASSGLPTPSARANQITEKGREVVLYSMGLLNTRYRFGGKNPSAGLDCSGMVSYIYRQAIDVKVTGSAADIARQGRPVARQDLRPGDLVFFNTRQFSFSHVAIFIGDGRFIHAPSSNGGIRIDTLANSYYKTRFEGARSYFD